MGIFFLQFLTEIAIYLRNGTIWAHVRLLWITNRNSWVASRSIRGGFSNLSGLEGWDAKGEIFWQISIITLIHIRLMYKLT